MRFRLYFGPRPRNCLVVGCFSATVFAHASAFGSDVPGIVVALGSSLWLGYTLHGVGGAVVVSILTAWLWNVLARGTISWPLAAVFGYWLGIFLEGLATAETRPAAPPPPGPPTFLQGSLAIIALCVALVPLMGQVMALIALAANWKARNWRKKVSWLALGLSLVCVLYALLFEALDLVRLVLR